MQNFIYTILLLWWWWWNTCRCTMIMGAYEWFISLLLMINMPIYNFIIHNVIHIIETPRNIDEFNGFKLYNQFSSAYELSKCKDHILDNNYSIVWKEDGIVHKHEDEKFIDGYYQTGGQSWHCILPSIWWFHQCTHHWYGLNNVTENRGPK